MFAGNALFVQAGSRTHLPMLVLAGLLLGTFVCYLLLYHKLSPKDTEGLHELHSPAEEEEEEEEEDGEKDDDTVELIEMNTFSETDDINSEINS